MKPLTTTSSSAFVTAFSPIAKVKSLGVQDYLNRARTKTFVEGTQAFEELRSCLLRESEQALLMGQNCYIRALEGLNEGSVYWSVVGFYYSAFLSIKAILGTYGCWMGGPKNWIEAAGTNAGSIRLQYQTTPYATQKGSHKISWIAYYEAMDALSSFLVSNDAIIATTPVFGRKTWMIDTRNDANYQPQSAFNLSKEFGSSFNPANVPGCFKGKLNTMMSVSRACAMFAKEAALRVGLNTDVWAPEVSRAEWVRNKVEGPQHAALRHYVDSEVPHFHF